LSLSCVPYVETGNIGYTRQKQTKENRETGNIGYTRQICFFLFFFVLCTLCYQFLWIVHFWLPLPYSLIIIDHLVNLLKMHEFCQILLFLGLEVPSYKAIPSAMKKRPFKRRDLSW
jgi:hypothetical protein